MLKSRAMAASRPAGQARRGRQPATHNPGISVTRRGGEVRPVYGGVSAVYGSLHFPLTSVTFILAHSGKTACLASSDLSTAPWY